MKYLTKYIEFGIFSPDYINSSTQYMYYSEVLEYVHKANNQFSTIATCILSDIN